MEAIDARIKTWLRSEDPSKAQELAWSDDLARVSAHLEADPEGVYYTLTADGWFCDIFFPDHGFPELKETTIRGSDSDHYYIFPFPHDASPRFRYHRTIPQLPSVVLQFDRFARADFVPLDDNFDLRPDDLVDNVDIVIGRISQIENVAGRPSECAPGCKGHTVAEKDIGKAKAMLRVRHSASFTLEREEYKTSAHFRVHFTEPVSLRVIDNAVLSLRGLLSAISKENLNVERVWVNPHNWTQPDRADSPGYVGYYNVDWRKGTEPGATPLPGVNLPLEQFLQAWLTATFDDRITDGILACIYESKRRPATYQEALGSLLYGLEAASAILESSILKLNFLKRMNFDVGIDEATFGQDPDRLAKQLWEWRNIRYGHREDLRRSTADHTGTLRNAPTLYRYAYTLLCWIVLKHLGLDGIKSLTLRVV